MTWRVHFADATGHTLVTAWDRACFSIFRMGAGAFRDLWAQGEEDDQQEAILTRLNANLDTKYRCACSARMWQDTLQVSVNLAEPTD